MNDLRFVAISPMWHQPEVAELQLDTCVWVRKLEDAEKPNFANWEEFLSGREISNLNSVSRWIVCEFSSGFRDDEQWNNALARVHDAIVALQIASPSGTFENPASVAVCRRNGGLQLEQFLHNPPLSSTMWGRRIGIQPVTSKQVQTIVAGVTEASRKGIVRLQNALHLFEHGLQARNSHIRVLFWTTALDALLMANNKPTFRSRLGALLGPQSFVFPEDEFAGQPKYKVCDVADDLYELRSCIAHGKAIPKSFREQSGFLDLEDRPVEGYEHGFQYRYVLEEVALCLLCSALGRVFREGLTAVVSKEKQWRNFLTGPK